MEHWRHDSGTRPPRELVDEAIEEWRRCADNEIAALAHEVLALREELVQHEQGGYERGWDDSSESRGHAKRRARELEAENARLREELATERKDRREPGCVCTWEVGDSPCPVHPLNPNTELPYTAREAADLEAENARLRAELDALKASVAAGT